VAAVLEDLTALPYTSAPEIYEHLHATYWPQCDKRVLVSAKPHDERGRGNYHHTRDLAAACGLASLWLDCGVPEERAVFQSFLGDMKAGQAAVLGWYTSERTGITTASAYGIGTVPADFYANASIFSGADHVLKLPAVPPLPTLENKAYIALFISDGDNIQYNQHALRRVWDSPATGRGEMPLNWTISPALADLGPGILNYYYSTATPADCFVCGPSGLGYAIPTNTLHEPGAPVGEFLKEPERMLGYTQLTQRYLARTGLRVVTIWDDASPALREAYARNVPALLGATVQNFKDMPAVASSVSSTGLRFEKLKIPYASSYAHLHGSLVQELRKWSGQGPLFLAYQANIWSELKPERLRELQANLAAEFPGKTAFVRADHFFSLQKPAPKP
jgi:hypothetical protein